MELFVASKEIEFDAGHRVPNHRSKCHNPHGHRYRVRANASGPLCQEAGDSSEGMVVDFGDLKELLTTRVHDVLDHGFMVYADDRMMLNALHPASTLGSGPDWKVIVLPFVPTAENLAKWVFDQVQPELQDRWGELLCLTSIDLWETPTSLARYSRADPHSG